MRMFMEQNKVTATFDDGKEYRVKSIEMYDGHTTAEVWMEATDGSGDEEWFVWYFMDETLIDSILGNDFDNVVYNDKTYHK